jgi:chemotaxis protein MotB
MTKIKKYFVFPLVFFLLLFFISGCVSTKKHNDLISKFKQQNEKLIRANEQINKLELQVSKLERLSEMQRGVAEQELTFVTQTYDMLIDDLKQEIDDGKVEVEQIRGKLSMSVAEELFFETGEADLKPAGQEVLKRIGTILKKIPEKNIRIEGHTDTVPIGPSLRSKYPTNWELAAIRAVNVVRFLQNNARIDPLRLSAVSYGQYRPIASNKTKAGKAKNRRIEIILIDRDLDLAKKMKENLGS